MQKEPGIRWDVWLSCLVALRAGNETGSIELPVGAALIAACLGSLALWYCHLIFTSEVMRSFSEIHAMG